MMFCELTTCLQVTGCYTDCTKKLNIKHNFHTTNILKKYLSGITYLWIRDCNCKIRLSKSKLNPKHTCILTLKNREFTYKSKTSKCVSVRTDFYYTMLGLT